MARVEVRDTTLTLWISKNDVRDFAPSWPCSGMVGHRFRAEFSQDGLLAVTCDGVEHLPEGVDGTAFGVLCARLLRESLPQDHPAYFVTVGQFEYDE